MRTIAMELDYLFLKYRHFAALREPVFGCSSPACNQLRDSITNTLIEEALELMSDDVISSFTYEHCIPIDNLKNYIEAKQNSSDIKIFFGLTCDEKELEEPVESSERAPLDKVDHFQLPTDAMSSEIFETPDYLNPRSLSTRPAETSKTTAQTILAMLPNDIKRNIMF